MKATPMPTTQAATLTAIVLTFNEEKHLDRALSSLKGIADQVIVVDSLSNDRTVTIAQSHGATVIQHPWEHNYARQLNWALASAPIVGNWVLRLDADEYLTPELAQWLSLHLGSLSRDIDGIYVRRRVHFMGRWIRHGGMYPMWVLRVWRAGRGRCESRWMDEHIVLDGGKAIRVKADLIDENLNDIRWWMTKHIDYSRREAADLNVGGRSRGASGIGGGLHGQAAMRRILKTSIYGRLPKYWRAGVYFVYRYCFRLGFLDGTPGLIWHILQGFWYRFIVDVHLRELSSVVAGGFATEEALRVKWGLEEGSS